ncbi:hypothetical protein DPMN_041836 [Dreissena polymorpha]|uniref:DUF6729 domain-containing protein n=1 Tax=Dreissena polymorpha TaxID=45954 RepID=A0A9D4CXN0_DREPO|nr:hypothetical protein DPMN_041836 [Dreissena polymorpha]
MPRKQWKVQLYCPHPGCDRQELASAGINHKVRQVVDIDGFYNLACDNLECMKCRRRVLSWSHAILSQLDIGHRVQFPCILTAKHACDMSNVLLLRNRGLGNSCSQIRNKVDEQHHEAWLRQNARYLTDCEGFIDASQSGLLVNVLIADPPERAPLPRHRWFMNIYIQDVFQRLDEIKASITSVSGRILKMDSTNQVVKKLAGRPDKTALWCTNVENENEQILNSVMTTSEGHGLTKMLVRIVKRYKNADIPPPEILYLDRDCCGASTLQDVLKPSDWKHTVVRLDIWHCMRRIATGCSTDSHALYSTFMGLMSNCIFIWYEEDFQRFLQSKKNELTKQGIHYNSDEDVVKTLSRYELALHCRRKTRGVPETTRLLRELIQTFSGEKGRDTLGVPLINSSRMKGIWEAQERHIACIQDPPGISLYNRTGSTKKGGIDQLQMCSWINVVGKFPFAPEPVYSR